MILETLKRTVAYYCDPPHFNFRVRDFNSHVKYLVASHEDMFFWYHKGLASEVTKYISDGVHLTDQGNRLYVRSLRNAVRKYTTDLQ